VAGTFLERREVILAVLAEDSTVSVSDLARRLGVSVVTARTDLTALEEEGILVRTHGGAMPAFHPQILSRMRQDKDVKASIAKEAARLVNDGDVIIITAGTTAAMIAKYLLGRRNVHIITNNTLLLTYARTNPQLRVTLVGGEFRSSEEGLVGPLALQALDTFYASKAFIGKFTFSIKKNSGLNQEMKASKFSKSKE